MITLPVGVEIPTHTPNEFKKRTYPETVNLYGSNIYCDDYSFANLELAWNKVKQQ